MNNEEIRNRIEELERRLDHYQKRAEANYLLLRWTMMALGFVDVARGREDFRIALKTTVDSLRRNVRPDGYDVPFQRELRRAFDMAEQALDFVPVAWSGPSLTWPTDLPQNYELGPLAPGADDYMIENAEFRYLGNLTASQWRTLSDFCASERRAGHFLWNGEALSIQSWHGTQDGQDWRNVGVIVKRIMSTGNDKEPES
jgi:hypothetical protein